MTRLRSLALLPFVLLTAPSPAAGQSVVVDEGVFTISLDGVPVGEETFSIRRSGLGTDGSLLGHGVVRITVDGAVTEVRPVLQARPSDGSTGEYQVRVTGADAQEARLALAGNRYISQFTSSGGTEEREFLARPGTRILEVMVAHQYYFLRGVRPGMPSFIIEPRSRASLSLPATDINEDTVQVGPNSVQARRVVFGEGETARTVWYDTQGRVLRVEVPALGYTAHRQDLAG